MKFLFIALAILPFSYAISDNPDLSDAFIKAINEKQHSWLAGRNFPEDTPRQHLKRLAGRIESKEKINITTKIHTVLADLPENFDARDYWPECPSTRDIRDQEQCGSCWAFGVVESITDRLCIATNGAQQFKFSTEDLIDCCDDCGSCDGGNEAPALQYWVQHGIVSGGDYNSNEGCQPYSADSVSGHTPACSTSCLNKNYAIPYEQDKHYGESFYQVSMDQQQIQTEIFMNGPVSAGFDVYDDFLNYKSGVYVHTYGDEPGGHIIKILGWGVEDGLPYWLVANSWGSWWGDGGFFKILRGENHCGIEAAVFAGTPRV